LFQLVVLCFCTTPGATSVVVFFWTTAPLPQVVLEVCVPGAGMVVVVVCDVDAGATTVGGATWTKGGGGDSTVLDSTVLLKHPAPISAADTARADIVIPGRTI
jgi:hypothetical protein